MKWQGMETAPRDGRKILVWVGWNWNGRAPFVVTRWLGYWENEERNGGMPDNFRPTHWMPLLEKPEKE